MLNRRSLWTTIGRNAAIALGVIAVAGAVIALLAGQIASMSENIKESKRISAALDARQELLAGLMTDMQAAKGAGERVRTAFLPATDVLEFVGATESMALKHNVTETITFDTPRETPHTIDEVSLVEIPFALSVEGNVFTFLAFLADVERLPYFMKITSITIVGPQEGGWQNLSNIAVRGALYAKDIR